MEEIRHLAAIAGYVTNEISSKGIPAAVVEVVGQNLRTKTQNDGFFYFIDLPVGNYFLKISAPDLGTRYGEVEISDVAVQTETIENVTLENITVIKPILDPKANVQLSPTSLVGEVKRSDNDEAIAQAVIRLLGSEAQTLTDNEGKYGLYDLRESKPSVQVSATGFVTATQTVPLTAGQATTANFSLIPTS